MISQLALYYKEACCKRSSRNATEEPPACVLSSQLSHISFLSGMSSPSCLTHSGGLNCSMIACHLLPQSTYDSIKALGKPPKLSLICQQLIQSHLVGAALLPSIDLVCLQCCEGSAMILLWHPSASWHPCPCCAKSCPSPSPAPNFTSSHPLQASTECPQPG